MIRNIVRLPPSGTYQRITPPTRAPHQDPRQAEEGEEEQDEEGPRRRQRIKDHHPRLRKVRRVRPHLRHHGLCQEVRAQFQAEEEGEEEQDEEGQRDEVSRGVQQDPAAKGERTLQEDPHSSFQKRYKQKQYKNGFKFAKQILPPPRLSLSQSPPPPKKIQVHFVPSCHRVFPYITVKR